MCVCKEDVGTLKLNLKLKLKAFEKVLQNTHMELVASKRNVWQGLQQQVSLVLMTLDFQPLGLLNGQIEAFRQVPGALRGEFHADPAPDVRAFASFC